MAPQLRQAWPDPGKRVPIVIVGAGGIVNDAHLPAYELAGFEVAGITDIDPENAASTAGKWGIGKVHATVADATVHGTGCIYDLATPPAAIPAILEQLPEGSTVLIQKPMGEDLAQAHRIRELCATRNLDAAVNFQLRFSPMMLAVRDALESGLLGELLDVEVHVNIQTPWQLFPFLKAMQRVEIAVHSIHYLDLLRSVAGEPAGVFARTMPDPRVPDMAQTKTSVILDYGTRLRALLSVNHNHDFGRDFQAATVRFEGSRGCIVAKLGLLLNYPDGEPDELWYCAAGEDWQAIELQGRWFPHAFANIMRNVQRFHAGEDTELLTGVPDSLKTMALVESCFVASRTPSVAIEGTN